MTPDLFHTPPAPSRYVREKTAQRGYGKPHQRLRAYFRPIVEAGLESCRRCRKPIRPGEPWDLGHSELDRRVWSGPEHARCNRSTATTFKRKVSRRW